jgi:hypothetical protein
MGLYKGKVHSIFMGSCILPSADDKRRLNVSREKVRTKKRKKERKQKKLSTKKHNIPSFGLGGLSHKKRRAELPEGRNMSKNIKKTQYMR